MTKKKKTTKKSRCWTGYKPKPGSTPYAPGSCVKEANINLGRVIAEVLGLTEGAAWTRSEGQNPDGGLNAKGRASAKKEGHNLKAPVTKKNPKGKAKARKKSFCARMSGMRKRQKPSNNTGDDRLSKSLRKWNC